MTRLLFPRRVAPALLGVALLLGACESDRMHSPGDEPSIAAKRGPKPPPPPPGETITVTGTVTSYGFNREGDADKLFLRTSSATWEVRFPPHEGDNVMAVASVGESGVTVTGKKHTDPEGRTHISLQKISDSNGNSYTLGAAPPPPPPGEEPPPPPPPGETVTVSGTATEYEFNREGDADGFFLQTGGGRLEIRFPPREGDRVMAVVQAGESGITVTGMERTDPEGRTHINAKEISDSEGNSVTLGP